MNRARELTFVAALCLALMGGAPAASSGAASQEYGSQGNIWKHLGDADRQQVTELADRFKTMIGAARSELMMVREGVRYAEQHGFVRWDPHRSKPQPGDRYYAVNRDRTMVLWVVGQEPLRSGMRLINSHIDSVRLELKPHPLKERTGTVTLDTLAHGGIKGYQWVNVPLALTGRVDRKDGSTVWLDLGLKAGDPVLLIPDLAPHVDRDYRSRSRAEAIRLEELDPVLVGAPPAADSGVDGLVQKAELLLKEQYGIETDDWISADIQIVPATPPRDVGLDRTLIAAFGLDDRLTGIVNMFALAEMQRPTHTAMTYLVTDEEVGSGWNVGVSSEWFRKLISEMIRAEQNSVTELDVMETFSNTDMVTADTTTATNPLWPAPQAPGNASLMHHGLVIKLYGPGRNPNSEFVARLRRLLDDAGVAWQTHSYKAGYGGGTISRYFAGMNMEVTDWGVGIWSMHSTYDIASKADIWALWKGFLAFFRS
ncbi:MAG: aminopeptidase 1 [Acidobacteriota bacterium]